jgi:2-dehydropantoate 2-reductase
MRVAIMGAGGVGGYFGGLLAKAGHDVTFIARGEHLQAIRAHGLRVESVHGDFLVQPAQATDNAADVGPVDVVLFTTKTYHIEQAAEAMRPLVGPQTAILPLQNGVDASERLFPFFGPEPVLGGTCHVVSLVAAPGVIQQRSTFRRIGVGELQEGPVTPRVQAIADALVQAGAEAEASTNINKGRWAKFVFIAAISGVGAVTRVPAEQIVGCPETRQMLEQAMREVEALAAASGVTLDADIVPKTMEFCDNLAPGTTASMQRDILEGRPSELESQNGFAARQGAKLGVPVPVNAFIYAALLPQERRARKRESEQ